LSDIKLTAFQVKALNYLSTVERTTPRVFAEKMWPDSNMHSRSSNQGNGSCRGKAAWLSGGSYLRKLEKKGWVRWVVEFGHGTLYAINQEGRKVLIKNLTG